MLADSHAILALTAFVTLTATYLDITEQIGGSVN